MALYRDPVVYKAYQISEKRDGWEALLWSALVGFVIWAYAVGETGETIGLLAFALFTLVVDYLDANSEAKLVKCGPVENPE